MLNKLSTQNVRYFNHIFKCLHRSQYKRAYLNPKLLVLNCHEILLQNTRLIHLFNNQKSNNNNNYNENKTKNYVITLATTAVLSYFCYKRLIQDSTKNIVYANTLKNNETNNEKKHRTVRPELPTYKMDDISKHSTLETGIWISYGIGVYDITKFVPEHPGGDKIMMGAGAAIDPFWHMFQQHNTPQVLELLESYRIGNLNPEDDVGTKDLFDPWSNEPKRHSLLKPTSKKPFNAETPAKVLVESFITPTDFFYVRNHLPVPDVDIETFEIIIEDETNPNTKPITIKYDDLKKLPKHSVTAAIMCGGNRRSEMHKVKPVKGLSWGAGAVGNAVWSGAKLSDILNQMGIKSDDSRHVHFEGLDADVSASQYAASIPLFKAIDPRGDVILAYEMNGETLSRDHGYPVRVIVPGVVGARNVKWLCRIAIADDEHESHWQRGDYKGFSPSTDWDTVDFSKSISMQNMPVTSAICDPQPGDRVQVDTDGCITVRGYAWSGGGNKIVRVDITADGGKSWHVADLIENDNDDNTGNNEETNKLLKPTGRDWAWMLWKAKIPVPINSNECEIWSKAVDSNYNVQPETFENTWNLRGVLSHAYCRVKVLLTK